VVVSIDTAAAASELHQTGIADAGRLGRRLHQDIPGLSIVDWDENPADREEARTARSL